MTNEDRMESARKYIEKGISLDGPQPTPELALFLAHHDDVTFSEAVFLNSFPFRERMSEEDWRELWQRIRPIVHDYWWRFHGSKQQL